MNPDAVRTLMAEAVGPLLAAAVPAARMLGVFTILPLFTRLGITGLLRGGVSLALALPLMPALYGPLAPLAAGGAGPLVVLLLKETLVGVLLGLLAGVPFWAAESAGEILDQQRGSQSALLPDPSGAGETGVTGTLLVLVAAVVFLGGGGLHLLQDGIFQTYAVWPADRLLPAFSAEMPAVMLGVLDRLLTGGLLLASPLLIAMLLAELSLAMISRFAPNLNVFDLGMAVKGIVHAVGLPIYALVLLGYIRDGFAPLKWIADELARLGP